MRKSKIIKVKSIENKKIISAMAKAITTTVIAKVIKIKTMVIRIKIGNRIKI